MSRVAKKGDQVSIELYGKLNDGTEVISTSSSGPLPFVLGEAVILDKITEAIEGMTDGESKSVQLTAEEAFGEVNEELIIEVPANKLPENAEVGSILTSETDEEQQWRVLEVQEEVAVIDGNHPLAGQSLAFEIKLVSISDKPSDEPVIQ